MGVSADNRTIVVAVFVTVPSPDALQVGLMQCHDASGRIHQGHIVQVGGGHQEVIIGRSANHQVGPRAMGSDCGL